VRTAIDGTFLYPGAVGGAEHMFRALLSALACQADLNMEFAVYVQPAAVSVIPDLPTNFKTVQVEIVGNRFLTSEKIALRESYDCYLSMNYYTPVSALLRRKSAITVVHDLQFRRFPQFFSLKKRMFQRVALGVTARTATKIISISEFTKKEMISYYPSAAGRVVVIPNAVLWDRFRDEEPPTGHEVPAHGFFLLAAAHYPHKNIRLAVDAFSILRSTGIERDLVLLRRSLVSGL
jgi:glycosyltransferase involved in cell wall biosynthesis